MPKFNPIPTPPPFTPPTPRSSSSAGSKLLQSGVPAESPGDVEAALTECEQRMGYTFQNRDILKRSLTHSSAASTRLDCNERMEFLGDAVLGMVICEFLYQRFPDRREGELTQQKSRLVSRTVCGQIGERLRLHELMFVGKGLQAVPLSLKAAVVEAVIAAVYLDGGFDAASQFIQRLFSPELDNCHIVDAENYKSLLQEETQRESSVTPSYVIVEQRGPDHAREFQVAVEIGDQRFQSAWGHSKKEAEQKAAMLALEALNNTQVPPSAGEDNGHDSGDGSVADD
ncbi:MAG: ribonuclease III [Planctomycetaceae bacterium]